MLDNNQSTFGLTSNLEGRIRNLALSPSPVNSVYPLLEAVMNGIQAIQDRFGDTHLSKGKIQIVIHRSSEEINISVVDNGIGLNDENFESFITPDTDYKLQRGGKGVGRLTWLKTFRSTHVESFFDVDGVLHKRSFIFKNMEGNAISEHTYEEAGVGKASGTYIQLTEMREGYAQTFPAKGETIATHIIRHFLPIVVSGECPEILLYDNDKEINIASELNRNIQEQTEGQVTFTTTDNKDVSLDIVHMRITSRYAPKSSPVDMMKEGKAHNAVYFAADQRVGFEYALDNQLGLTTFDRCKYVGFIAGAFLNEHMNQERTFLDLPTEDVRRLKDRVYDSVIEFLSPFMDEVKGRQQKEFERIENAFPTLAASAPKDYISSLPFSMIKGEDILADLAKRKSRAHNSAKAETTVLEEKIEELAGATSDITIAQEKEIIELVERLRPKLTRETNATLAEYMIRRKAVIDLLDQYMGLADNGKHFKEDLIHTLICPMHQIDNTKRLMDHNLWLLDDRFAFYSFLASDKALSQYTPTSELGRPDILFILNEKLAFKHQDERDTPVFIVEFKRPSKSNYHTSGDKDWDTEDPFDRFFSYRETLHKGIDGERTYDGRRIHIPEGRPFHCFLIADMTPSLEKKCKTRLSPIEGATSYYGHIPNLGFVHAISYDDLIHNAKLRHEVFFEQLGIKA